MKQFIFALITLTFLQQARAQIPQMIPVQQQQAFVPQTQQAPAFLPYQNQQFAPINSVASICPQPMLPAQGAYAEADQVDRRKNYGKELKSRVNKEQARLRKLDKRLEELQEKIDGRFQPEFSSLIIDHIQQKGNPSDYARDCAAARGPSAGSTASDVPVDNAGVTPSNPNATAQAQTAALPINPRCEGPIAAVWARNAQSNGRVNPNACAEPSQLVVRPGSSAYAGSCRSALTQYMDLSSKRRAAEADLAEARSKYDDFEFGEGEDDDIEAGECVSGNCGKRGNSARPSSGESNQWMSLLQTGIAVGIPALLNWQNQKAQRESMERMNRYNVDTCAQLGYHPGYAGCSMLNRFPPYRGHQAMPYPSPMPGYFGGYNGQYGAVPGAIGQGGFSCAPGGFNQFGMPTTQFGGVPGAPQYIPVGSQYPQVLNGVPFAGTTAPGIVPYLGGQGAWGGTPYLQNGQYNTGMPPAVLPYQANAPGYNQYLLNNELSLINSRIGAGGAPPPYLPIQNTQYSQALSAPVMAPIGGVGGQYYNTQPVTTVSNGVMYGR